MARTRALNALAGVLLVATAPLTAGAEAPPAVSVPRLALESALAVARAALQACREAGVQVAVTVVDRGGHPQVVLRDTLAPDLTLSVSRQKAYTAMSFATATSALEGRFPGAYGVPKAPGVMIAAGGLPIAAGGRLYGGVGVSGAPSGELDERCARAGVAAVQETLEFMD